MAFVYQSKRKLTYSPGGNLSIGPGAYLGQAEFKKEKSQIPFSSSSLRLTAQKPPSHPGPGSYDPVGEQLRPDQFGRFKCSASFASNQDRFGQTAKGLMPGPGSYEVVKSLIQSKPTQSSHFTKPLQKFASVPSIPSQQQGYGYDETEAGELIIQKNPHTVHSGTSGNSVGPGQYNPRPVSEIYGNKGTTWHKSASKREVVPSDPFNNIGPGSYTEAAGQTIYKLKSSSAFASMCKRESYIPNESYMEEWQQDEKDGTPGPGHYFAVQESRSQKSLKDFQKFGSGTRRFLESKDSLPGPGQYLDVKGDSKVIRERTKAPFASTDNRFPAKSSENPGPGHYREENFIDQMNKKSSVSKEGAFGSSETRFPDKFKKEIPGPGQYELNNRVGIHNQALHKASAVFSSKVPKNYSAPVAEFPPPGQYNLPSEFRVKEHNFTQPMLVKVNVGVDKLLGFNCKEDRWKEKESEVPGPGKYHTKSIKVKKSASQKSFGTKQARFMNAESRMPGPGAYVDGNNYWNKKTFNIQFTDST